MNSTHQIQQEDKRASQQRHGGGGQRPSYEPMEEDSTRGGGRWRGGEGGGGGGNNSSRGGGGRDVDLRGERRRERHDRERRADDGPYRGPPGNVTESFYTNRDMAEAGSSRGGGGGGSARSVREGKKACDCEIVCINRNQRPYAESVEARLKNLGMEVDVLFPNPEIPLVKILGDISSRGVVFAVLVTPMHQEHRSMTVNVLAGQAQEHRNMPLDDAVNLMAKIFGDNLEANAGGGEQTLLPKDVGSVVGFLSENRPLSVMEIDKLIKFLAQRRERMLRTEYGESIPAHLVTPPIGPPMDPVMRAKEEDLKARILGILNRPKEPAQHQPVQHQPSLLPPASINPDLQRAIDSLISSGPNLLSQQQPQPGGSGFGANLLGRPPNNQQHQQQHDMFAAYGGGY